MATRFIARQPVFDRRMKVFGYELLFRSSEDNFFKPRSGAAQSVIADSATLFDLDVLVGHARAFVNLDERGLLQEAAYLLPAERVVVEVLETVTPSDAVVAACEKLVEAGYLLALDDFVDHKKWDELVDIAAFLKVDFRLCNDGERQAIAEKYLRRGKHLLAEKVESQGEVDFARGAGYGYFQGYFFCKPAMVSAKEVPGHKVNYVRLLKEAAQEEMDFEAIDEIFRQDPSLTLRLLRYLNSPLHGLRNEVHSIRHAMTLLGQLDFQRWVSIVAVVAMGGDKPAELIRLALTRAYFCEAIAEDAGLGTRKAELFLMGLLSVTDAMLDQPMEHVMKQLPVSDEIRRALTGGPSRFYDLYRVLLGYEKADWGSLGEAVKAVDLTETDIPERYVAAATKASVVPSE